MRAMVLERPGEPLRLRELPEPEPGPDQVRVRVRACAVCRTDLHIVDGELPKPKLPLVPGHQIVGTIERLGADIRHFARGQRVGIPWLGRTCGGCSWCRSGRENLCDDATFTGYHIDGGFADLAVSDARFAFPLPDDYDDLQVAPLLCAGFIGYRAYRMAGEAERIGIYGFGSAAHILTQLARHEGRQIYAFTRPGDGDAQSFATRLGAAWVGGSDQRPPALLDAAIVFAPDGATVPAALRAVIKGGTVVCGGIHMSDIPSFPYSILWEERVLRSVANLTRSDGERFLAVAPSVPIRTEVRAYELPDSNRALEDLRAGRFVGAAVITVA